MRAIVILLSLTIAAAVMAQPRGHGTPPFVTACESMNAGDSCSFEGRNGGTIEGVCTQKTNPRSNEEELVCWNESAMKKMGSRPGAGRRR